ncbi:MAG: cyclopropane-fatty-acyl-phospholipid synthase family protein [Pseudomonadota bacterium]
MWDRMLDALLSHLFQSGQLHLTFPNGQTRCYGDGAGPQVRVTLHDDALPRKLILSPELATGEAYMDGKLTIDEDDLKNFLALTIQNLAAQGQPWFRMPLVWLRHLGRRAQQFNPAHRARQNVAHHYDLSSELYDLFLDQDRQYSCAYFDRPNMTLEEAQAAKKHHIARKLLIEPGMRVLDIGCGWGGMGLTLAEDFGADVVGVTLSEEQHGLANRRVAEAGLSRGVSFQLIDYRHLEGTFDRIVSVGMFEHVGLPHFNEYFGKVRSLLADDGVALIHTIGRGNGPGATSPWINKYIFPGGYVPALSETMKSVERQDLVTTDIEVWRLHYAETLRHWHARFVANIDLARALYDERFCRMWQYYLLTCELSFRFDRQVVFQLQLATKQENVPLTRDYLYDIESAGERRKAG